jgi:hypothetical protein
MKGYVSVMTATAALIQTCTRIMEVQRSNPGRDILQKHFSHVACRFHPDRSTDSSRVIADLPLTV